MNTTVLAQDMWKRISNVLEVEVTVKAKGTIQVNEDLAVKSSPGLWDLFTVSTAPPEGSDELLVKGKVELIEEEGYNDTSGFKLEYLEQHSGKFFEMNFEDNVAYFGPLAGFPWTKVDHSVFRVTWKDAGYYMFKISIVDAVTGEELACEENIEVEVIDEEFLPNPITLMHALDEDEITTPPDIMDFTELDLHITAEEGDKFGYWVMAGLTYGDEGIDHVDGGLYILEITREDGGMISSEDLQIQYFRKTGTGYLELIEVEDKTKLIGQFPDQIFTIYNEEGETLPDFLGFLDISSPAWTPFEVTFKTAGTYNIMIYAVQVPAPAQIN